MSGYIYVIQMNPNVNEFKIGKTKRDVISLHQRYKTSSPQLFVHFFLSVKNRKECEKECHRLLNTYSVKNSEVFKTSFENIRTAILTVLAFDNMYKNEQEDTQMSQEPETKPERPKFVQIVSNNDIDISSENIQVNKIVNVVTPLNRVKKDSKSQIMEQMKEKLKKKKLELSNRTYLSLFDCLRQRIDELNEKDYINMSEKEMLYEIGKYVPIKIYNTDAKYELFGKTTEDAVRIAKIPDGYKLLKMVKKKKIDDKDIYRDDKDRLCCQKKGYCEYQLCKTKTGFVKQNGKNYEYRCSKHK